MSWKVGGHDMCGMGVFIDWLLGGCGCVKVGVGVGETTSLPLCDVCTYIHCVFYCRNRWSL